MMINKHFSHKFFEIRSALSYGMDYWDYYFYFNWWVD